MWFIPKTILAILAFITFVAAPLPAHAQESRVALIIGNGGYDHLPRLRNPENDANTLATALANLGFTVYVATNLKQAELVQAIAIYARKARTADVSLFYYAGHSAALGAQNLIFPIDFQPDNKQHVSSVVSLSDITNLMQTGSGTNIFLFDACQESLNIETETGLAKLQQLSPKFPPVGTLISYASAPGHVAHDGLGHHSVFAGALLDNLSTPDISIEKTLQLVRRDVIRNSQGTQVPQTNSSLISDFYLYPTKDQNTSRSLKSALIQNGFAEKPILTTIANRAIVPVKTEPMNDEQIILRDILCAKISEPRPAICSK